MKKILCETRFFLPTSIVIRKKKMFSCSSAPCKKRWIALLHKEEQYTYTRTTKGKCMHSLPFRISRENCSAFVCASPPWPKKHLVTLTKYACTYFFIVSTPPPSYSRGEVNTYIYIYIHPIHVLSSTYGGVGCSGYTDPNSTEKRKERKELLFDFHRR